MSTQDTGGPAFPCSALQPGGPTMYADSEGMTLRDYFAAKALQGMLAENGGGAMSNVKLAEWAYDIADSMLKARSA